MFWFSFLIAAICAYARASMCSARQNEIEVICTGGKSSINCAHAWLPKSFSASRAGCKTTKACGSFQLWTEAIGFLCAADWGNCKCSEEKQSPDAERFEQNESM